MRRLVARVRDDEVRCGAHTLGALVVHRDDRGRVRAARNRCRHMGGTFESARGGCALKCPRHGWTLDASTMRYENPRGALAQAELEVEREGADLLFFEASRARPWAERMPREELAPGELTVKYLAHACAEITCGERTIVTDPWLLGPAFSRGWWLAHPPPADALERLARATLVFISHDHSDHLNEPTLRRLAGTRPDTPILVPAFASGRCERLVRRLGFSDVTAAPFGRWLPLGPRTRVMILGDGAGREDSALLVEHAGHTILDTVDCMNPNDGDLPEDVDLLLAQFAGGATGYPVCFEELYGPEKIAQLVRRNRLQARAYVLDLIARVRPRAWMPFAGYFHEAHPADARIARANQKNAPDEIARAVTRRFPDVRAHVPGAGATIDLADLRLTPGEPRAGAPEIEPFVSEIAQSLDFAPLQTLEGVQRYFDWAGFRGDLVLHVIETSEDFDAAVRELFVDFRDGKVGAARPPPAARYERMRVRSDVFRHVLRRGDSWEEISIGFQARFYREPDVYNMDFWLHFQHELPAEPLAW